MTRDERGMTRDEQLDSTAHLAITERLDDSVDAGTDDQVSEDVAGDELLDEDVVDTANDDEAGDEPAQAAPRKSDIGIVVALFVLLFGYDVAEAVANLQQLPLLYTQLGLADATPWPLLILGVAAPVICFGLSWWLGRGRGLVARAGYFLLGLAVSACLGLLFEELSRIIALSVLS